MRISATPITRELAARESDGVGALAAKSREREREARRRYQAAVAAAHEWLRYAEERFRDAASAIDAHIEMARAAAAGHP